MGCTKSPVFGQGFPTAKLTEVVRQAKGNPIIELATEFRNTVNTGDFFSFVPDGVHIQVLDRDTFEAEIIKEFDDPTWVHNRSKVLAWTNKTVIQYNHAIRDVVKGAPDFIDGDYAICNSYVAHKKGGIKTDQLVCITDIEDGVSKEGVPGRLYTLDHEYSFFMPINIEDKRRYRNRQRQLPITNFSP